MGSDAVLPDERKMRAARGILKPLFSVPDLNPDVIPSSDLRWRFSFRVAYSVFGTRRNRDSDEVHLYCDIRAK